MPSSTPVTSSPSPLPAGIAEKARSGPDAKQGQPVQHGQPDQQEVRISVNQLQVGYGSYVLMHDVTFDVHAGDIFFITGGSGCGKSTLLRVLMGLKAPQSGNVLYGKTDFWGSNEDERHQLVRETGVLFQSGALWSSWLSKYSIAFT